MNLNDKGHFMQNGLTDRGRRYFSEVTETGGKVYRLLLPISINCDIIRHVIISVSITSDLVRNLIIHTSILADAIRNVTVKSALISGNVVELTFQITLNMGENHIITKQVSVPANISMIAGDEFIFI